MNFNLESQISKLYELRTQLRNGQANYEKLLVQYDALITVIKESKKEDLPDDFVSGLIDNKNQFLEALPKMKLRISYLDSLIGRYEKQDDDSKLVEEIVTLVFNSLGIVTDAPEEIKE